jgi:hypothetical protein
MAEGGREVGEGVLDAIEGPPAVGDVVVAEHGGEVREGGAVGVGEPRPAEDLGLPAGERPAGFRLIGGACRALAVLPTPDLNPDLFPQLTRPQLTRPCRLVRRRVTLWVRGRRRERADRAGERHPGNGTEKCG